MDTQANKPSHSKPRKASDHWGAVPKWVLVRRPRLSGLEFAVLGLIASYDRRSSVGDNFGRQYGCIKSTYELADELGASRAWVSRAIHKLLSIGALVCAGKANNGVNRLRVIYGPFELVSKPTPPVSKPTLATVSKPTPPSIVADTCKTLEPFLEPRENQLMRQPYGLHSEDLPFID